MKRLGERDTDRTVLAHGGLCEDLDSADAQTRRDFGQWFVLSIPIPKDIAATCVIDEIKTEANAQIAGLRQLDAVSYLIRVV